MIRKQLAPLFIALFFALLLVACDTDGPADTVPDEGNDAGNTAVMTKEVAQELETLAVQSLQSQMMLFRGDAVMPLSAAGLASLGTVRLQQFDDCIDIRGDISDVDDDGIPAGAIYYFNCSESSDGYQLTITGSVSMKDFFPDDGYLIEFNDFYFEMVAQGQRSFFRADGFVKVQLPSSSLVYLATIDLEMSYAYQEETGALSLDLTQTFESYDAADRFARGKLSYEGNLTFTSEGKTYRLSLRTEPALEVRQNCASGFESGAVIYGDAQGNTMRIRVTCDGYSSTYNGQSF